MDDNDQSAHHGVSRAPIAAYFGRLAKSYGEGEYFGRRRAAAIAAIAGEIGRASTILDLGCGNGAFFRDLVRIGAAAKLVGADLSIDMMSEARSRLGARAHFVRADATALPFGAASWDLVFCSHVLQFVADLDGCVSGIARCLRPGGVIAATLEDSAIRETLGAIMMAEQWEEFRRAVFPAARPRRTRSGDEVYREAFERAGLVTEICAAPFTVTWPDIEEWVRVRWMPVASESGRADIERIMTSLSGDERIGAIALDHTERLLIGTKPV